MTTAHPRLQRHAPAAVWALGLALALAARPAAAQGGGAGRREARVAEARRSAWLPHLRLSAGSPQRASLLVGGMRILGQARDGSVVTGPVLAVEPGLRAGKARVGYAARTGLFGPGASLEAAYLRTGRPSAWGPAGGEFAGAEVHGTAAFLHAGVGAYRPLRGGGPARVAVAVGIGL